MASILIVDDREGMRRSLALLLKKEGHQVSTAETGESARHFLEREPFDLVITDLKMPSLSGLDILRMTRRVSPQTEVIVMTAYGSIESAVAAMKFGAYDYVTKPFKHNEILLKVKKALEKRELISQVQHLHEELRGQYGLEQIERLVGRSPAIVQLYSQLARVARTDLAVLITGETGTGKNLLARIIHYNSSRAAKPFVAVNCAALPENLLESELFGHTKGAFTGADHPRKGLFEEAEGGTFFLDEIGAIPTSIQSKLLGVLEDRVIRRIGSNTPIKVDVRIITATNRNLREAIKKGEFREDLYYRINVASLDVPPLRERREDIPLLVSHFLHRYGRQIGKREFGVSHEAMELLLQYDYPGNVRELENTIEQAAALAQGDLIQPRDLPTMIREGLLLTPVAPSSLKARERELIEEGLRRYNRNLTKTARELGISRVTLWRKIKEYGLS